MKDEMDILKEVGTTAAAHGSIALSEILGRKINLRLPSLEILPRERITKKMHIEGMVLTLQMQILSGLKGKIVFLLEEKSAFRLVDMCYKSREGSKKASIFTEMGMSVIKEVGNIIISSYISSLSFFIKKLIIPSFPMLINAPFAEIINTLTLGYEREDYILVVEAIFEEEKESIKGNFWLVLTPDAAEEIKRICKKMLEAINKD
ncbi:MAG: hypothetical protein B1H08_01600 [Candidatus Omnitrophica bacterium 4484_171]|nr:MAG: hypothetical protein B1H08_01600 [Candidatus Omnitrophica bacterium 4484_171]